MNGKSVGLAQFKTLRTDAWWVQPLLVVVGLGGFAIYTTWAALQNAHYFGAPISPRSTLPVFRPTANSCYGSRYRLMVEFIARVSDSLDSRWVSRHLLLLS